MTALKVRVIVKLRRISSSGRAGDGVSSGVISRSGVISHSCREKHGVSGGEISQSCKERDVATGDVISYDCRSR